MNFSVLKSNYAFGFYLLLASALLGFFIHNFFVGAIAAFFLGIVYAYVRENRSSVVERIKVVGTYVAFLTIINFWSIISITASQDIPLIGKILISLAFLAIYTFAVYAFFSSGECVGEKFKKKPTHP